MKVNSTIWSVIIILILTVFLQRECTRPVPTIVEKPIYIYERDTIKGDSIPYPVYVSIPGDTIKTRDTIYINDGSMPKDVWDIMVDYHSVKYYDNILVDDSSAYFKLYYSLYANATRSLNFEFVNKRPIDIICPEPYTPRNKLFIGGGVVGNLDTFGAGPAIALNTKRDNLYTYQYDAINKTHHVSTFWKLSFRK